MCEWVNKEADKQNSRRCYALHRSDCLGVKNKDFYTSKASDEAEDVKSSSDRKSQCQKSKKPSPFADKHQKINGILVRENGILF